MKHSLRNYLKHLCLVFLLLSGPLIHTPFDTPLTEVRGSSRGARQPGIG